MTQIETTALGELGGRLIARYEKAAIERLNPTYAGEAFPDQIERLARVNPVAIVAITAACWWPTGYFGCRTSQQSRFLNGAKRLHFFQR